MQELHKIHRAIGKQLPGAPHEVLLVFDGTSKGGRVVAIQKELGLPVKFTGPDEQPDDLQPFDARQFAQALFENVCRVQPNPNGTPSGFPISFTLATHSFPVV